ncbi:fructosamine kinase family protein [Aliiroseovarius sp.]|uniref:fructosamine kinase family protein n=1 Tax=Aliiroseovarius sp. TaxID=1872442 RepID=UPI00263390DD|nr:fructosamine kinase family protein [Aliiroseovarius sp.]
MDALIARITGSQVAATRPLHGGDLSEVTLVTLADGARLVAKRGPMVDREAVMLGIMGDAGAPVPGVLGVGGNVLLLDYLPETRPTPEGWRALGLGLGTLHGQEARGYGWDDDYAFGPVAIPNGWMEDWAVFWAERQVLPLARALPAPLARRVEVAAGRLPELIPARPRPALLHGDLWTGNVLFGAGSAHLIDPASYHGDPEVDLAMLELFGSPHPAFREVYGRPEGDWATRRAVYQLWPALVHVSLFGAGYHGMLSARLDALGT